MICEINEAIKQVDDFDQSHFFFLNGQVARVMNHEKIFYPACKSDRCSRKVYEDGDLWRCENCGISFSDFQPTYMFSVQVTDATDSMYVSFARETGN